MNRHKQIARQVLPLIDLTSLNDTDTEEDIIALCNKASGKQGHVAAVCIYPQFVKTAIRCLRLTGIPVATVVNFPNGNDPIDTTCQHIQQAIRNGATEIDVVMPYHRYLANHVDDVREFIRTCKITCGKQTILKVILETGALLDPSLIERAALDVIDAGADFIKTSTGKISIGATVSATQAMCQAIQKTHQHSGRNIGFKASGGIRFLAQTLPFLATIEEILGEQWLHPNTCRFGASSLLDDVLAQLR